LILQELKEIDQIASTTNTPQHKPKLEVPQERCTTSRGLPNNSNAQLQEMKRPKSEPPRAKCATQEEIDKT
jgi:hypothetical protein